jgi:hypothetical protein
MPGERTSNFAWQCALTTLLSAVLLFLVQPIISKIILPWFGGSPAVWTTCMLFFQTLLLAGYAYAHWLVRAFNLAWQMRIHALMALAAAITLPITPGQPALDADAEPARWILWILGMNVGLPFFVISATGPLLQSWFSQIYPGRLPYRLYALSNVGSLAALWLFPLVLEPKLNSAQQDLMWSAGFGLYMVLLFVMLITFERLPVDENELIYPQRASSMAKEPVRRRDVLLWMALPALASVMLVAVTSHICQDVAVVPFLWILPLSLYLITFILAFDSPRWYVRGAGGTLAALSLVACSVVAMDWEIQTYVRGKLPKLRLSEEFLTQYTDRADVEIGIYLLALFCVAMICHGETTRLKPPAGRLTLFYLAISAGGALGSASVAILCPLLFNGYYELGIAIVVGFVLASVVLVQAIQVAIPRPKPRMIAGGLASLLLACGLVFVISSQTQALRPEGDFQVRNFYGTAQVKTDLTDDGEPFGRVLYNGQINHGYQFLHGRQRYEPNSYYALGSGVDLAFHVLRERGKPLRVGVIGLGTGTLAAFGQKGDDFQFYEIDPKIERIAREYFTYLEDSPATTHVRLGDARLYLQQQLATSGPQNFDLLVVDAFSGDAIPVHLLTLQAFDLYREHIRRPGGILAIHVSNRHLNLQPVVARLAEELEASAVLIEREDPGEHSYNASSDWILVTGDQATLADPVLVAFGERLDGKFPKAPRWTDSFSNLWQVME